LQPQIMHFFSDILFVTCKSLLELSPLEDGASYGLGFLCTFS